MDAVDPLAITGDHAKTGVADKCHRKSVGPAANDRDQAIECPVPHLPCARRCETPECGAGEQRQAPNSAVVTEDDLVTNNDRV